MTYTTNNNNNVHTIVGEAYWSRIFGEPHEGYDPEIRQWSMDVAPDATSLSKLQTLGLEKKLKDDEKNTHDGKRYINFKRLEFKRGTTTPNQPISVLEKDGKTEWNDAEHLLGNGTEVEVKFSVYDIPARGRLPASKGVAILQVKVLKHVPYTPPDRDNAEVAEKPVKRRKSVSPEEEPWS